MSHSAEEMSMRIAGDEAQGVENVAREAGNAGESWIVRLRSIRR